MKDSPDRVGISLGRGVGSGRGRRVGRMVAWAGAFSICVGLYAGLVGCSGGAPVAQPGAGSVSGSTASVSVNGDWDDIHAAVAAGVSRAEMATLGYHDPDPSTRVYRLRTTTGQPGTLRVSRLDPPSADRPDPSGGRDPGANVDRGERIGLDATVGRFGDPRAETRLLTAVSRRLSELQGVDAAPLSW